MSIKNRRRLLMGMLAAAAGLGLAAAATLSHRGARAGVPTKDALFYSGVMVDKANALITVPRTVGLTLWDAETKGNKRCTTAPKIVPFTKGRFRLALSDACVKAVTQDLTLWVQLSDNGALLPRVRIGTVPFALTAGSAGGRRCPRRYQDFKLSAGSPLCAQANNVMVQVGDFWIDKYEMSVVDQATWNKGACNKATWKQYGITSGDMASAGFANSGASTTKLYACSVAGKTPSIYMTWFQAQQACANAGKQLCTNAQWQAAAAGTPDDNVSCNVDSKALHATGKNSACVSKHGAMDLVGNVWEWTADWGQAGMSWMGSSMGLSTAVWPSSYGDGKDAMMNVDSTTQDHNSLITRNWAAGLPAAYVRGGNSGRGKDCGVFALSLWLGPSMPAALGARCCVNNGRTGP